MEYVEQLITVVKNKYKLHVSYQEDKICDDLHKSILYLIKK